MLFRQLYDQDTHTYSYLIADPFSGQAVLVDPVLEEVERDLRLLKELGLRLSYCLETHIHADHVTATGLLRELTGCQGFIPIGAGANCADHQIQDHEELHLGSVVIQAIATPGHTNSHMAYWVNQDRVLTGDALLIRGCGRTDFQSGDPGSLFDSVTQRLFELPAETWVYPGHDYRGHSVSTIAEEKKWNSRFAGRTRADFIEFMNHLDLPLPKKIMEAVPANERCGHLASMV